MNKIIISYIIGFIVTILCFFIQLFIIGPGLEFYFIGVITSVYIYVKLNKTIEE